MGKQKKKQQKQHSLGATIIKDRFGKKRSTQSQGDTFLHTSELDDGYEWGRLNLQSVTEQSNLEDFLATAVLAGTEFTAEKLNIGFVNAAHPPGLLTKEEEKAVKETQEKHRALLTIPRRPEWDNLTTPEELDKNEKASFLTWRRQLAELQEVEGLILTPFEKNLQFWRQLWRVIEKSDAVVQIVDARNPLLFRCPDLETYVKEVDPDKVNMVLVNKADFLTDEQRVYWAEYFDKEDMLVSFWSATAETERQRALLAEENALEESDSTEKSSQESEEDEPDNDTSALTIPSSQTTVDNRLLDDSIDNMNTELVTQSVSDMQVETTNNSDDQCPITDIDNRLAEFGTSAENVGDSLDPAARNISDACTCDNTSNSSEDNHRTVHFITPEGAEMPPSSSTRDIAVKNVKNISDVLTGDELVEFLRNLPIKKKSEDGVSVIGMVGYPNVGKSSSINAILQTKKVPVSATPGRTKHFQTLYVDQTLLLCDCPGLVMPTFVSTKADMVLSGILPIDQMRDFVGPITRLGELMPRDVLEAQYGMLLPPPGEDDEADSPPTAHQLAGAYACMRGFMTHKGVPDYQRASRQLLKDYVTGKLRYCHCPPGTAVQEFRCVAPVAKAPPTHEYTPHRQDPVITGQVRRDMDKNFFSRVEPQMGAKGVQGARRVGSGIDSSSQSSTHDSVQSLPAKPWKKHNNNKSKEKLRRKYHHLDE